MTHIQAHRYFMKIAKGIGNAKKALVKLRWTLKYLQSLEDVPEFATLQLRTKNLADDVLALAEELHLLQTETTVKALACKRHVEPIGHNQTFKLLYSEATYKQREMMRKGVKFPAPREYSVDEIIPPLEPERSGRIPI